MIILIKICSDYYDNYNFFPHVYIPCAPSDKIVGSV